jgi:hypothetical protein
MAKRRLPVLNSPGGAAGDAGDGDDASVGGFLAWVGVAFFCALLVWLPLAALANEAVAAFAPAPASSREVLALPALVVLVAVHAAAFSCSAAAAGFIVGRFGGAASRASALVGVGIVAGLSVAIAGANAPLEAAAAAAVFVPLALVGVYAGFRIGRHTNAKGI